MTFDARGHYRGETAAEYEASRAAHPKWQAEQASVMRFLAMASPESVLDVPVGTGRFLPHYRGRVIGIDVSADMLAEAREQRVSADELDLRLGDVTALPLEDASVDTSVCVRFLNLVPFRTVDRAMHELTRVTSEHIIVGVRLQQAETLLHRVYQFRGRVRGRYRGQKVTAHEPNAFTALLQDLDLLVVEQDEIDRWPDGSAYYMFLLKVG